MLIDENGKQLGVTPTHQALRLSIERELDLVEVGPNAQPPIAKIMDLGKYIYQKEKQEKQSAAKRKDIETKTLRIGYKTGSHDLNVKAKKIDEFLEEGHNVKVELTLRGREKALAHLGKEKLVKFLTTLGIPHIVQGPPFRSPYGWVVMIQRDKKHHVKTQNKKGASEAHQDNIKPEDSETPSAPKPF